MWCRRNCQQAHGALYRAIPPKFRPLLSWVESDTPRSTNSFSLLPPPYHRPPLLPSLPSTLCILSSSSSSVAVNQQPHHSLCTVLTFYSSRTPGCTLNLQCQWKRGPGMRKSSTLELGDRSQYPTPLLQRRGCGGYHLFGRPLSNLLSSLLRYRKTGCSSLVMSYILKNSRVVFHPLHGVWLSLSTRDREVVLCRQTLIPPGRSDRDEFIR
jgi:hypothetical protein